MSLLENALQVLAGRQIWFSACRSGDGALPSVDRRRARIRLEIQQRIFSPSLYHAGLGTGLGLAHRRGCRPRSRGCIELRSQARCRCRVHRPPSHRYDRAFQFMSNSTCPSWSSRTIPACARPCDTLELAGRSFVAATTAGRHRALEAQVFHRRQRRAHGAHGRNRAIEGDCRRLRTCRSSLMIAYAEVEKAVDAMRSGACDFLLRSP